MSCWVIWVEVLFHIGYTYQDVYYVNKNNGHDDPKNCIYEYSPCKSPRYVIENYEPPNGVLKIEFMSGKFSLRNLEINCRTASSSFSHLYLHSKNQISTSIAMDGIYIKDCNVVIQSLQFQWNDSKLHTASSTGRINIINSSVEFIDVNFIDIYQKIQLIHSNLTMANINYSFGQKSSHINHISNTPLIYAVSSLKSHSNNYIMLKNWNLNFVPNPLVIAHESMIEIRDVLVSNHYIANRPPVTFFKMNLPYFISLHNTPQTTISNVSISHSNFLSTIIHIENSDYPVLLNQLSVADCYIGEMTQDLVSIIEIRGKVKFHLDEINVKNTQVDVLFQLSRESKFSSLKNVNYNPNRTIYCDSGYYMTHGSCFPCQPGSFQPKNKTQVNSCSLCPPGTFSELAGGVMCNDCEPGTYCKYEGCTTCEHCNIKFSTSHHKATGCYVLPTLLYVASSFSLALILLPSLALLIKNQRKSSKKKKQ